MQQQWTGDKDELDDAIDAKMLYGNHSCNQIQQVNSEIWTLASFTRWHQHYKKKNYQLKHDYSML